MKGQRQYGIQMKMPNKGQQKLKEHFYHITKAQALWMTTNMKGQRQYGIQIEMPNKGQQKLKEKFYHITKTQGNNTLVKKFNDKRLISTNIVNMYREINKLILTNYDKTCKLPYFQLSINIKTHTTVLKQMKCSPRIKSICMFVAMS